MCNTGSVIKIEEGREEEPLPETYTDLDITIHDRCSVPDSSRLHHRYMTFDV